MPRIHVPDLNDDNEEDVDNPVNVRHYFEAYKAGSATSAPIRENEASEAIVTTASRPQSAPSDQLPVPEDATRSNPPVAVAGSSFENAFGNLKSSKFYEAPQEQPAEGSKQGEKGAAKTNSIIVNPRQRGNPVLKHIRNVPYEFDEIEPDYILGQTTCALFLSLRYNNLFPNYIHDRLKSLGKTFALRVLLVQVDVGDPHPALRELSKIAILADCTLMLAWSPEEVGRYLETYKIYENKSADLIMEKSEEDTFGKLVDCLSSVKSINRPDAIMLLSNFGTLEKLSQASKEQLTLCPGMGPLKANRLHDILHQPFVKSRKGTTPSDS